MRKVFEYLDHRCFYLCLMLMRQHRDTLNTAIRHDARAAEGLTGLTQGDGVTNLLIQLVRHRIKVTDDSHLACCYAHVIQYRRTGFPRYTMNSECVSHISLRMVGDASCRVSLHR